MALMSFSPITMTADTKATMAINSISIRYVAKASNCVVVLLNFESGYSDHNRAILVSLPSKGRYSA